jgi:hypothetical protein
MTILPLSLLMGCQSRPAVVVIPEDKRVLYVMPGSTNTQEGYFVPKARMQEILRALATRTNTPAQ